MGESELAGLGFLADLELANLRLSGNLNRTTSLEVVIRVRASRAPSCDPSVRDNSVGEMCNLLCWRNRNRLIWQRSNDTLNKQHL